MSGTDHKMDGDNAGSGNNSIVVSVECLVNILTYLSINDLIKVIEDDNRLISVARQAFVTQLAFNRKTINVTNKYDPLHEEVPNSWKILKYFGGVISHLDINYLDEYRQFDHIIDEAIVKYCHDTLRSIVFENPTQFTMFELDKPFEKVDRVSIIDGEICAPVFNFAKWFPNAIELNLLGSLLADLPSSFPKHCPNLKVFDICGVQLLNNDPKYLNQIAKVIALNPQLEELKITEQEHDSTLLNLITEENVEFPKTLEIMSSPGLKGEKFVWHFKTLEKLKIYEPGNKLQISVDETEELILAGIKVTNHWLKSIEKNKRAKVIHLHGAWANNEIAIKFVEKVKICMELRILMCPKLSVDQIVELATHFKELEQFYVRGIGEDKIQMGNALDLIKAATNDAWKLDFYDKKNLLFLDCFCHRNYYGFERV